MIIATLRRWFQSHNRVLPRKPIRRKAQIALESLQDRFLPSASVALNPTTHDLAIMGDNGGDDVEIAVRNGRVRVQVDGKTFSFRAGQVDQIIFNGRAGNDSFSNNTSIPSVANGGTGNDALRGGRSRDRLLGGSGADDLDGRGGRDVVFGQGGRDHLLGGLGDDSLSGGGGDDSLDGEEGDDLLHGGTDDDDCYGGMDDDHVFGDDGDDRLVGGHGADDLHGGTGTDSAFGDSDDSEFECEDNELAAVLTGASAALGFAEFEQTTEDPYNFELGIHGGPANQSFAVFLNDAEIGTIDLNAEGEGELKLNDPALTVAAGDTLAVKDGLGGVLLQGDFGQAVDEEGDND